MSSQSKTFKIGRDAQTGEFVSVEYAEKHPGQYTVERMPKSGEGVPKELKGIVSRPPKDANKKSSTEILKELRYEVKPRKR